MLLIFYLRFSVQVANSSMLIGDKQDIMSLAQEYSSDDVQYLLKIEVSTLGDEG